MFSEAYVVILFTWSRVSLVPGSFQVLGPMLLRGGGEGLGCPWYQAPSLGGG